MPAPEMMAIGDSLFNGVRSLTINQQLAQWSAPAQIARALGEPFAIPDYPRNVVINFEQWLHDFPFVTTSLQDLEQNIRYWDTQPRSALTDFDNIAIASARYEHLYNWTWDDAQIDLDEIRVALGNQFHEPNARLGDLFFDFNTRFLLNPTGDPATPKRSPLQIVADRKPKRLLVSIGHNNGVWEMGFGAKASSGLGGVSDDQPFNAGDVQQLARFVQELKALPAEVKHIYINAMPLPSDVADLMPVPDTSDTHKPGPGGYYPVYENSLGFNYANLTAAQAKANDDLVRQVNAMVAQEAATEARIHIVPIDQAFQDWNFKADPNAKTVTFDGKVISNLMIQAGGLILPLGWRGGLMGLDGMHPSILGYAVMAQEILKAIQAHEGLNPVAPIDLYRAYLADSLLQRPPSAWGAFFVTQLEVRRLTQRAPDLEQLAAGLMPTTSLHQSIAQLVPMLRFRLD